MKIMTNYYYTNSNGNTKIAWDTSGSNNWARPATLNTELNGSSFYSNNTYIDATHRGYITKGTWYTGGESPSGTYTLQAFVTGERSSNATSNIGLMSMVDFGYAGSSCTLSTEMNSNGNACMSNNWIGYANYQWSITHDSGNSGYLWYVHVGGYPTYSWGTPNSTNYGVRPALFLDPTVKITKGSGTETDPYLITK